MYSAIGQRLHQRCNMHQSETFLLRWGRSVGFVELFFSLPLLSFFFFSFSSGKLRYTLRGKILLLLLHKLNDNGGLDFNVPSIVVERLVISVLYLKLEWFSVCVCVYRLCYKACMQLDIYTTIINETSAFVVIVLKNNSSFWYTRRYTFNKIWSLFLLYQSKSIFILWYFFTWRRPVSDLEISLSSRKLGYLYIYMIIEQPRTCACDRTY